MKILLLSINASFTHTSIAIRSLKNYAEKYFDGKAEKPEIVCGEYTINQNISFVLREIDASGADFVLFSTYIWNAEYVCKVIPDVKKILPNCVIGAGGPEFSYGAEKYLSKLKDLDFIIKGEGEQTFLDFCKAALLCQSDYADLDYGMIPGIWFRGRGSDEDLIMFSGDRCYMENLDDIPFYYPEILDGNFDPDHKIYYYESSRGCPFNCAYCLSSVDKRVRFKSLERVYAELKIFLDAGVKLVKFVDRTYNINPERYIKIWQFILDNHNNKTMFHFEIEAEFLSEEALDFLKQVPAGVMQFEMGVQSANKKTLKTINRSQNIEKLAENIKRIPATIHRHLDLIAGLPFEDLNSFGESFDFVMKLWPDAIQLGFLKVLHGTEMEAYAKQNGWKWMESPAYEIYSTPYLTYREMLFLKDIETLTDVFWNKAVFAKTFSYLFSCESPWKVLCTLLKQAEDVDALSQARKEFWWFDFLAEYFDQQKKSKVRVLSEVDWNVAKELLRYDYISSGKKGSFPAWYKRCYSKEKHLEFLAKRENGGAKIGFASSDYDEFSFDVTKKQPEKFPGTFPVMFVY